MQLEEAEAWPERTACFVCGRDIRKRPAGKAHALSERIGVIDMIGTAKMASCETGKEIGLKFDNSHVSPPSALLYTIGPCASPKVVVGERCLPSIPFAKLRLQIGGVADTLRRVEPYHVLSVKQSKKM